MGNKISRIKRMPILLSKSKAIFFKCLISSTLLKMTSTTIQTMSIFSLFSLNPSKIMNKISLKMLNKDNHPLKMLKTSNKHKKLTKKMFQIISSREKMRVNKQFKVHKQLRVHKSFRVHKQFRVYKQFRVHRQLRVHRQFKVHKQQYLIHQFK